MLRNHSKEWLSHGPRLLLFALPKCFMLAFFRSPRAALHSMPQSDRNSQKENKSRGNEPNFNWRGVILIAIAFALIGLAVLFRGGAYQAYEDVPYNRFLELLENKQIVNDKNYPLQLGGRGRPADPNPARILFQARRGARRATGAVSHHDLPELHHESPGQAWRRPEFSRRFGPSRMCWRKPCRLSPDRRFPRSFFISSSASRSAWPARAR